MKTTTLQIEDKITTTLLFTVKLRHAALTVKSGFELV